MRLPPATHLLLAAVLASPAGAQFLNRAVFLGLESEGLRRDYEQNASYFMDRDSYVRLPPWARETLDPFVPGVGYRFGSVSASEFTVEALARVAVPLDGRYGSGGGERWRFTYDVLQSEHQDTRFLRNALGFELDLDPSTALIAQGEILTEKSQIDASLGVHLFRGERSGLRVLLTAVDLPNDKGEVDEYRSDPYGWMASGFAISADGRREVAFEIAGQLPLCVRDQRSGERLDLHRHLGSLSGRWHFDDRHAVDVEIEGEWTDKSFYDGAGARAETFDRHRVRLGSEWWTECDDGWGFAFGGSFLSLDAEGRRPTDPGNGLALDRQEWFATARAQVPLAERWALEPFVQAGYVRFRENDGSLPARVEDVFRGKLSANVRYAFADGVFLTFVVSAELHEPGFGGGGAQFVARF